MEDGSLWKQLEAVVGVPLKHFMHKWTHSLMEGKKIPKQKNLNTYIVGVRSSESALPFCRSNSIGLLYFLDTSNVQIHLGTTHFVENILKYQVTPDTGFLFSSILPTQR